MLNSYFVRDIEIKNGLVLSPMSGVTTRAFRRLIKQLNGDNLGMSVSEFISVEAMTRGVKRSLEMMRFHEEERPYCIQIFGHDITRMSDAARMVEDSGADILDINCGCPAPKVVRKGGGCELMNQPEHLAKILRTVRNRIQIPLTLKIRSGWDENSKNALEIGKIAEGEGVEALALHGRTRRQLYRGEADWELVAQVAQELQIPVLGSGDVVDLGTAQKRLKLGIKGIYIGRGAMRNPYVFSDIVANRFRDLRADSALLLDVLERYLGLLAEDLVPERSVGKIKQLVSQMGKGHPWRREICVARSYEEILEVIQRYRSLEEYEELAERMTA